MSLSQSGFAPALKAKLFSICSTIFSATFEVAAMTALNFDQLQPLPVKILRLLIDFPLQHLDGRAEISRGQKLVN